MVSGQRFPVLRFGTAVSDSSIPVSLFFLIHDVCHKLAINSVQFYVHLRQLSVAAYEVLD